MRPFRGPAVSRDASGAALCSASRRRAPVSRWGPALAPQPSHFLPSGAAAVAGGPAVAGSGWGTAGSGAGQRGGSGGLEKSTRSSGGGGQRLIPLARLSRNTAVTDARGVRSSGRAMLSTPVPAPEPPSPYRPRQPVPLTPGGREPGGFVPLVPMAVSPRRFVRRRRRCLPGHAPVCPPWLGPGSLLPDPWHCSSALSPLRRPRAASLPFSFSRAI